MTQLYPWPSRFLNIGRRNEPDTKPKKNIKAKRNSKKKKVGARSSSRMIRVINQKISVVKSDILIAKQLKNSTTSLNMFTPIVSSFNTVSHHFVSRYLKPKIIDLGRCPKRNPRLDVTKRSNQSTKKEMNHYVSVERFEEKKCVPTRHPRKIFKGNSQKAIKENKRPSSAPTSKMKRVQSIDAKNSKVIRRPSSANKSSEYSDKLFDMEIKFPKTFVHKKQPRITKNTYRKKINSTICVEGFQDNFSLKCDSKIMNDLNPQLFGSLTSTCPYRRKFKENITNAKKPLGDFPRKIIVKEKNGNISKRKKVKMNKIPAIDRKVQHFPSNIPEQALTRLKRRTTPTKPVLSKISACLENRNLFCEANTIIEENLEAETIDERQNDVDSNCNSNIQEKEEMKNELFDILMRTNIIQNSKKRRKLSTCSKKGEHLVERQGFEENSFQRGRVLSLNSENSSISSRPCCKSKRQPKFVHYAEDQSKPERSNKRNSIHAIKINKFKKVNQTPNEIDHAMDLQDLLSELYGKNDSIHENFKQIQKSLRRSFFTVSQNDSSIYETCRTHLSGDDLLVKDSTNGRTPPPPTPNNEELCMETKESSHSRIDVEQKMSSSYGAEENVPPSNLNTPSDNSSMCKGLATDILGNSILATTLSRNSGKLSTEERSDVFQTSQLSSHRRVGNIKKHRKYERNVEDNYIEQLCEKKRLTDGRRNMLSIHHKVEKIPSISDTFIQELFPHFGFTNQSYNDIRRKKLKSSIEKDLDNVQQDQKVAHCESKQSKFPRFKWKSAPTLLGEKNSETCKPICSKNKKISRINNVSSTSNNTDSINSNMEIFSEKGNKTHVVPQNNLLNQSREVHGDRSWYSSEASSLSSSPTELPKDSKVTLESIIECFSGVGCNTTKDISLSDVLKDLSELERDDILKRIIDGSMENISSLESIKKMNDSQTSENNAEHIGQSEVTGISDLDVCASKANLDHLNPKIYFSTVFLKSPRDSYRLSKESVPESFEEAVSGNSGNERNISASELF